MDPVPEINLNLNTAKDTAKKTANQATSSLKAAGSLVAKKAERTKLVTVTLPRAYAELGKSVYKDASHRDEFPDLLQSVDNFLAERKRIAEEGRARPAGTTVTEKAKKVAADAADMARTKAIDLQAFQAFAKLGEAVFLQYGGSASAAETVEPIAKAIARRDALDREVGAINSSAKGKWITPTRILWAAGILVFLGVLGNLADDKTDSSATKPGRTPVTKQKSNKDDATPVARADDLGEPDDDDWTGKSLYAEINPQQLEYPAKLAKEAQATLEAGPRPGEENYFNNVEKKALLRTIEQYTQLKQQHEAAVKAYASHQKERKKEKQAAAVAAKKGLSPEQSDQAGRSKGTGGTKGSLAGKSPSLSRGWFESPYDYMNRVVNTVLPFAYGPIKSIKWQTSAKAEYNRGGGWYGEVVTAGGEKLYAGIRRTKGGDFIWYSSPYFGAEASLIDATKYWDSKGKPLDAESFWKRDGSSLGEMRAQANRSRDQSIKSFKEDFMKGRWK